MTTTEVGRPFRIVSDFQITGDQPQAIDEPVLRYVRERRGGA